MKQVIRNHFVLILVLIMTLNIFSVTVCASGETEMDCAECMECDAAESSALRVVKCEHIYTLTFSNRMVFLNDYHHRVYTTQVKQCTKCGARTVTDTGAWFDEDHIVPNLVLDYIDGAMHVYTGTCIECNGVVRRVFEDPLPK